MQVDPNKDIFTQAAELANIYDTPQGLRLLLNDPVEGEGVITELTRDALRAGIIGSRPVSLKDWHKHVGLTSHTLKTFRCQGKAPRGFVNGKQRKSTEAALYAYNLALMILGRDADAKRAA